MVIVILYFCRGLACLWTLLLAAAVVLGSGAGSASAAKLSSRQVRIGSSLPSVMTIYELHFTIGTVGLIGSIEFEYCTNNPFVGTSCVAPAGLDFTSAALTAQSGETGFSVDAGNTTANRMVITRPVAVAAAQAASYTFDPVTNPSTPKQTVYVRMATFATTDATGPFTDEGAAALSTSGSLAVGGFVPPFITLCAGITVNGNCSIVQGSLLELGELSASAARSGTSQFAVATNDPAGYTTSVIGTTLTSGNNVIPAAAAPQPSSPGNGQFGINLRNNTAPDVGEEPTGLGSGTISADYGTVDQYKFVSGDQLVASADPTEFNTFTVSYIANVAASQAPGAYAATMTYIATAAF